MRSAYRVLANLVALEVVIQAAAIAYAIFGLTLFIEEGGVVDKAAQESGVEFEGVVGFIVHGINGEIVMPVIGLVMLIVAFFAKVPRGVMYGAVTFGLIVLQVLLGIFGHALPFLGLLHGLNALAIFMVAYLAARAAGSASGVAPAATADRAVA